ncbi:hypothetical protein J6590_041621 [Homalodisca vitripennis]|nr:hypothetical protein J6590_041621 [Homalodisca vitripennis]
MLTVATKEIIAVSRHSDKDVGSPASCAESQISEIAFRFCREFLPGSWRTIQLSDLIFHKISLHHHAKLELQKLLIYVARTPVPSGILENILALRHSAVCVTVQDPFKYIETWRR